MKHYVLTAPFFSLGLAGPLLQAHHVVRPRFGVENSTNNSMPTGSASVGTMPPLSTGTGSPSPSNSNSTLSSQSNGTSDGPPSFSGSNPNDQTGLKVVNPKNFSCSSVPGMTGEKIWETIDGDAVMKSFQDMFFSDALVCKPCFGMTKDQCHDPDPSCQMGIRELATDKNGSDPRWDVAVARFSRNTGGYSMNCEIGSGQCSSAPDCEQTSGPGAWAMWEQMVNMHGALNGIYNALQSARDSAALQMQKFSAQFAPLPKENNDSLFMSLGLGIFGGIVGLAGIEGAVLAIGIGAMETVVMTEGFKDTHKPADTGSILGTYANATLDFYDTLTSSLFSKGQQVWIDPTGKKNTTLTMADVFRNGTYMQESQDPATFQAKMVPKFEKILLQSVIHFTWQYLQSDGAIHRPYIVFNNQPCNKVDPKDPKGLEKIQLKGVGGKYNPFGGLSKADTQLDLDGKCYYLLDARPTKPDTIQITPGAPNMFPVFPCRGAGALPGGKNKDMGQKGALFANMTLADFITPSVRGWEQNDHKNGYPTTGSMGLIVNDTQQAGAVNITVCDFLKDVNHPGAGCPLLDGMADAPKDSNSDSKKGCAVVDAPKDPQNTNLPH